MKWATYLIIAICLILSFVCVYLFIEDVGLKKSCNEFRYREEKELKLRLEEIRDKIRKDLDKKYNESLASFEKLAGNLESERKKAKGLEEKILRMKK